MTLGKLAFIFAYLGVGIWAIFFIPSALNLKRQYQLPGFLNWSITAPRPPSKWTYHLIHLIGCASLTLIPWTYVAFSLLLSLIAAHCSKAHYRKQLGYGIFISLIACSFLAWWLKDGVNRLRLDWVHALIPIFISGLLFYLDRSWFSKIFNSKSRLDWRIPLYTAVAICVIVLTFTAGIGLNTYSINQWHHWGAYIGPAQLMQLGVIPFNEVPLQYGLGPSLLMSFGCQSDCWGSFYWISGLFTVAMVYLLAYIALKLNHPKTFLRELFILVVVVISCLIWTALPMKLESVLATPSTTGLRFLPGVAMTALLIHTLFQSSSKDAVLNLKHSPFTWRYLPHNFLWLFSIGYSPEAGIQTSVLWFGYWILINLKNSQGFLIGVLSSCWQLSVILVAGVIILCAGFLMRWGEWPSFMGYVTYLIHPPGPLPVNPNGSIWFVVMVLIIFFVWVKERSLELRKHPEIASLWLVFLLCYANFTYFIGRSADNNILNLLPYFSILLIGLQSQLCQGISKTIATILITALVSWLPLMGWDNYHRAIKLGEFFSLSAEKLTHSFSRTNPASRQYFQITQDLSNSQDVGKILDFIDKNYQESAEVIDRFNLIDTGQLLPPWNGLHGPANFTYIPSFLRKRYLEKVRNQLNQPGWIVINLKLKESVNWIEDYSFAYAEDKRFYVGDYVAIRFLPRNLIAQ